jgi:hypothetical protein
MLKSKSTDTEPFLLDLTVRSPASPPPTTIEGLHCFVDTDELRRLLCLMACTELLTELCRSLRKASSAREMTLPPTFL